MSPVWFLLVTLCAAGGTECNDYVVDGGMTFADCKAAVVEFPAKPSLYSLRCERGDVVRESSRKK